jgi:hypothetical protein
MPAYRVTDITPTLVIVRTVAWGTVPVSYYAQPARVPEKKTEPVKAPSPVLEPAPLKR